MEETNNKKRLKSKKVFTAFIVKSIREIVDVVHENQIAKEDIVTILSTKDDRYAILCYK